LYLDCYWSSFWLIWVLNFEKVRTSYNVNAYNQLWRSESSHFQWSKFSAFERDVCLIALLLYLMCYQSIRFLSKRKFTLQWHISVTFKINWRTNTIPRIQMSIFWPSYVTNTIPNLGPSSVTLLPHQFCWLEIILNFICSILVYYNCTSILARLQNRYFDLFKNCEWDVLMNCCLLSLSNNIYLHSENFEKLGVVKNTCNGICSIYFLEVFSEVFV